MLDTAQTALELLEPANEPKQRVGRMSLRQRDYLFGILADAHAYMTDKQRRIAEGLYDVHVARLDELGLEPITLRPKQASTTATTSSLQPEKSAEEPSQALQAAV